MKPMGIRRIIHGRHSRTGVYSLSRKKKF